MLKGRYGDHDYSLYPDLTDYNIMTLIEHKNPKTYEEFHECASKLQRKVKIIHDFQESRKKRTAL